MLCEVRRTTEYWNLSINLSIGLAGHILALDAMATVLDVGSTRTWHASRLRNPVFALLFVPHSVPRTLGNAAFVLIY